MRYQFAGVVALLCAAPMFAQQYGGGYPQPGPPRPHGQEVYERVQQDLNRVAAAPYLDRGERHRVEHARHEVWNVQRRLSQGRFDRGKMDGAIGAVQRVVDSRRLDPGSRQMLAQDLGQMRELRARAYRGPGYSGWR